MDIVNYLTNIYGYDTPIFLKDIRIGRKSKAAIKEELYRATKEGKIKRRANGIYYIQSDKEFAGISFSKILKKKYIYSDDAPAGLEELFIEGYYSGLTFLNIIGISQQVPAVLEITTNKTSSKKRYYSVDKLGAYIRKSRTTITSKNYRILQFLDMFSFISLEEVINNKELISKYIKDNFITMQSISQYIGLYSAKTIKKITDGGIFDAFI